MKTKARMIHSVKNGSLSSQITQDFSSRAQNNFRRKVKKKKENYFALCDLQKMLQNLTLQNIA